MNSVFLRAFAALFALCPCAAPAAGFEPGPRPEGAIHDPSEILGSADRKEISLPLEKILRDEGVDVIAVVLENKDGVVPEALAGGMAAAWCEAGLHAVALHIPGREGTPWIVVGGDLIDSINHDELRDELAAIRRDAMREPDDVSIIRTASHSTTDMLRFWNGRELTRGKAVEKARAEIRLELDIIARRQRTQMVLVSVAAILLIAATTAFLRMFLKKRGIHTTGS